MFGIKYSVGIGDIPTWISFRKMAGGWILWKTDSRRERWH